MNQVSIIVLNHNYPHNIQRMLPSLQRTTDVEYETVVVDNGSEPKVVQVLKDFKAQGLIDILVLEPVNHYFSEGNNIGVHNSDPNSEFILLLNNDVKILDNAGWWLRRMIDWADGIPEPLIPYAWSTKPTRPKNIRRGIVSIDWMYYEHVNGHVLPDGWCCLVRREAWRNMDPDFPMAYGIMKMLASAVRDGHPCGCLSQYANTIKHYGQGSKTPGEKISVKGKPDMEGWWKDLECESLDFTLGEHQDQSYMSWSRRIEDEYQNACKEKTDINEHMETLYALARECLHVVEAGVRYVVSTWAWIFGCACHGGEVHSYCWTKLPEIEQALDLIIDKEGLPWHFHKGDWLQQEIPHTDLLFIDTNHFYSQLKEELHLHGPKARKYIVLHDTENFGQVGADGKMPGLWQAVEEFVAEGAWKIKKHYTHNNGLTVLERVGA